MINDELQAHCQSQICKAAMDYLSAGIGLFKKHQSSPEWTGYQAAIGNLAISIELMLKAFIAGKHLTLLFNNLPLDVKAYLNCADSLPKDFHEQPFDIEIRSASYTTIELDECISLFYIFYPNEKQKLQSHLRFVSKVRNFCVHSFLPAYYRFELERSAFAALNIYKILHSTFPSACSGFHSSPWEEKFLSDFQVTKLDRMHKKVELAKGEAKKLTSKPSEIISTTISHWEHEIVLCPICSSEALVFGSTELVQGEPDQNGIIPPPSLFFSQIV